MKTFELQIYRDGGWMIDSFFDDRELALFEAQRMERSHRYSGVRVVEETHESGTGQIRSRTVFQRTVAQKKPAARERSTVDPRRFRRPTPAKRKKKGAGPIPLVLTFGGLVLLGIAGVILLRFLAESL